MSEKEITPVWPVLIVGGGVVGLSAALFLAWHAIPCVLIERQARTLNDPRSACLSPRSIELFRSIGLEDAVRQNGALAVAEVGAAQRSDIDISDIVFDDTSICARDQLAPLLRAHAEDAGSELRFGTALMSFEQDSTGICAIVRERATGIERPIRARFMLVTDDSRGRARRSLDIAEHSLHAREQVAHIADRFQQGRVFLAGDAAHCIPPSGDLNTDIGIHDAHNLAWKLAAVLKGMAGDALLATYDAERQPVVERTIQQALLGTQAQNQCDQNGQPGTCAAHVVLERNGERFSTLDLFGRYFVLLTGANGSDWRDAALCVSDRMGIELVARRIGHGGDLIDVDRRWNAAYGVSATGAVLVRPDGMIGWRAVSATEKPEHTLAQALAQLLGRTGDTMTR